MKSLTAVWLILLMAVTACAAEPARQESASAPQGTAASEKTVYVDVRTPQEYEEGHVKGAILIPHDQMDARWKELSEYKDKPVVLYCRSGRRSQIAYDVLKDKGFTNLKNGGGFEDLAKQGVPTEK